MTDAACGWTVCSVRDNIFQQTLCKFSAEGIDSPPCEGERYRIEINGQLDEFSMRVLIASQYYRPAGIMVDVHQAYSFGGTVANAVALAEGLARMGHRVSVATTTRLDIGKRAPWRSRIESMGGVTVHYLGTWRSFCKGNLNPAVLKYAPPGKFNFDVLHILGLYDSIGPFLASVAAWRKVPYSIEPAGLLIAGKRTVQGKRLYHHFVGRRFLSGAKAVVVATRMGWAFLSEGT
jgi:hypothetical protein